MLERLERLSSNACMWSAIALGSLPLCCPRIAVTLKPVQNHPFKALHCWPLPPAPEVAVLRLDEVQLEALGRTLQQREHVRAFIRPVAVQSTRNC